MVDLVDLQKQLDELQQQVKLASVPKKPARRPNKVQPFDTVWVAVVVVVNEVMVHAPNVGPISGMAGLFSKVSSPLVAEQHTSARVAAVAGTEQECRDLLDKWKANHGTIDGESIVVEVPFGQAADIGSDDRSAFQGGDLPRLNCMHCGAGIVSGSRCLPCADAWNKRMRDEDPELLAEIGKVRK